MSSFGSLRCGPFERNDTVLARGGGGLSGRMSVSFDCFHKLRLDMDGWHGHSNGIRGAGGPS